MNKKLIDSIKNISDLLRKIQISLFQKRYISIPKKVYEYCKKKIDGIITEQEDAWFIQVMSQKNV